MTTWPTMEGIALAEVQLMDREAEASSTILNKDARKLLAASTWAVETLPKLRALVSRWETCTRADSDIRETYYDAAQELAALRALVEQQREALREAQRVVRALIEVRWQWSWPRPHVHTKWGATQEEARVAAEAATKEVSRE